MLIKFLDLNVIFVIVNLVKNLKDIIMEIKKRQFAIQGLRRHSLKWGPRNEAKYAARTERKINEATGRMAWHSKCNICGVEKPDGVMELDHIRPCVSPAGWTNFDDFIEVLYSDSDNFQVICESCHNIKSLSEGQIRTKKRKKKKK